MAVTKPHTAQSHGIRTIPPVDPIWVDEYGVLGFQSFPTLATQTVLTGLATRLEATDGSTRATGGWPLQSSSAINPAVFTSGGKYTFSVWVDKGSGFAEVACYAKGLGRYDNDKYRALYLEIAVDGTVPVYPAITAGNAAARKSNVPATSTANGWVVQLRLTTAATLSPLTRGVNDVATPATLWEDMTAGVDGQCPLAWRQDVTKMGRTNAVVLCTDPNYLTKCGAFPYLLTRTEEETAGSYAGNTAATIAATAVTHNDNFDRYIRDMWWDNVRGESTGFAPQAKFTNRVITNATFRWSDGDTAGAIEDLTVTNRNAYLASPDTVWGASQPPQYGPWRLMVGGATNGNANGLQANYYDRAQLYRKKYCQTGELEYYRRFCAHAFGYRHWSRFDDELQDHVYGPTGQQIFSYQPQGIGEYFLLSGDPYALTHIEAQAERTRLWSDFGDSGSGSAEPRPMARTIHVHRHAYNITRPANASYPEGSTPGTNGVQSQDWATTLLDKVTRALTGSGHTGTGGVTFTGGTYIGLPAPGPQGQFWSDLAATPGVYWRETDASGPLLPASERLTMTLEQAGQNPFMMAILPEALISTAHNNPSVGGAIQLAIPADVERVARFQYATLWEGTPADNPNNPVTSQPCFRVAFNSYPHVDQYAWYQCASDLTMLYAHLFAWSSWQRQSGELRALCERVVANGLISAYHFGSKQAQEAHCFMAECFAALSKAPSAGTIPTYDVASEVKLSATSGNIPVTTNTTITARVRDARRVKLTTIPTVATSDATKATASITSTATDDTGSTFTITIVGVAVGSATITVSDPGTGVSATYAATVTTPQFTETFSTTPLSGNANWSLSLSGIGAYVDSPSGELRAGTTGSFGTVNAQAKMVNPFILGAVGTHDVAWEWTAATNVANQQADIWIVDASGNGFGIQTMNGSSFSIESVTVAANVASAAIAFLAVGAVASPVSGSPAPLYIRFSQNGTNWAIDYSANGTSWTSWTSGTLVSANNPVTTAMKLVFIGHANGVNTACECRFDNITWT